MASSNESLVRMMLRQIDVQHITVQKLTHMHSCHYSCEGGNPPV